MTGKLRIAIADDEADMRDFLAKMLPRCGHEVVSIAATGTKLLEDCRLHQPDLVITDIKMPGLDGIEAATLLNRERPVPVILASAYHDPALIERAEMDHVCAYLVKPITFVDLQPAIAVAVKRFAEMQDLRQENAALRQALNDQRENEGA